MLCNLFTENLIGLQHIEDKLFNKTKPDLTHCCAKSGLSVILTNSFFKHGFFF